MMPPIIQGGQGRSSDDVRDSASAIAFFALLAILGAVACAIAGSF